MIIMLLLFGVLLSVVVSAAFTIKITAETTRKMESYVDDMYDMNLKYCDKIKQTILSHLENLLNTHSDK